MEKKTTKGVLVRKGKNSEYHYIINNNTYNGFGKIFSKKRLNENTHQQRWMPSNHQNKLG